MANLKGSDNPFPSILIAEATEPAAPAAGHQRLYVDSTSHALMITNSSGTQSAVGGAAGAQTAYGCRVFRDTSDQALGNNTFTAVQFNNETFDTSTMHDNSTNNTRITIPSISGVTTGLWRFVAKGYTGATALRADVKLRKGGSTDYDIFIGLTGPSGAFPFFGSWTVVCTAADYFEAMVRTTSGSFDLIATDSTSLPFFSAEFLGKVS